MSASRRMRILEWHEPGTRRTGGVLVEIRRPRGIRQPVVQKPAVIVGRREIGIAVRVVVDGVNAAGVHIIGGAVADCALHQ
eukprot:1628889-Prymnesium_polylepis.1